MRLQELADSLGLPLVGDGELLVEGVADLQSAVSHQLAFYDGSLPLDLLANSDAGCLIVKGDTKLLPKRNYLLSNHPAIDLDRAALLLGFREESSYFSSIHPTAVIHPSAQVDPSAIIGPYVVVDGFAIIEAEVVIAPFCYIGPKAKVGKRSRLDPHVVLYRHAVIQEDVHLQAGVIIGPPGFGFRSNGRGASRLIHYSNVVIEREVEIGANSVVASGRFTSTSIGWGTKIDALVLIAHNVSIGIWNLIAGQVGIAGSAKTGAKVVMGGKAALSDGVSLPDDTTIAAYSGVSKSLLKGGVYSGRPAVPLREHNRRYVYLRNIENYVSEVKELKERVAHLEKKEGG